MIKMNWVTDRFLIVDNHEKAAAAWGKALDDILGEMLALEEKWGKGISISFIGLYKQLGQLDFCSLEEFELMAKELEDKHGEICDASEGQSGTRPLMLTPKGRMMAESRREPRIMKH